MTRLVLVRHGESLNHRENRYTGTSDVGMTSEGYRQAERLADWAAGADLTAVVSSPMIRTMRTAGPTAQRLGLEVRIVDHLREVDFGDLDGLTMAEARQRYPEQTAAFQRNPVHHHFPNAEDPVAAAERGARALRDVAAQNPGGRVLVVAHSTLIRLTLCHLLGVPLHRYRIVMPEMGNCAVTEIRLAGDDAALLSFNVPVAVPDGPAR